MGNLADLSFKARMGSKGRKEPRSKYDSERKATWKHRKNLIVKHRHFFCILVAVIRN